MGIFDTLKKQMVAVIDWAEDSNGVLSFRFPMIDREIQNGASLTVRESQLALFVNEGEIADLFRPGRYTLSTKNLPLLTALKNWDKGFHSPFKSDVFFLSTREQIDQKWGTPNPITLRDKEMGPIRLRAFGSYSYKIKNPQVFFKKIAGTRDFYTTQELEGQLRSTIITSLGSFFGQSGIAFLDMASNQMKFSETLQTALTPSFIQYGLELNTFYVQSISLPEELQAYFDKASQMRLVGDLSKYARFQAAESMQAAATNSSGLGAAGAAIGTGVALGQTLSSALNQSLNSGEASQSDSEDPMSLIGKLHEMMKKGILSEAEFNEKKTELLKRIK